MNIGGAGRSAMKWAKGVMGGTKSPINRAFSGASKDALPFSGWDNVSPEASRLAGQFATGAVAGMAVSVPTAIADRDRSVLSSGIIGGAIWGGLAGIGGARLGGHMRSSLNAQARLLGKGSARKAIRQQVHGGMPRMLSNAGLVGGGVTGAYGIGNFMRGGSKRRKHYTTFHHGEYRNQQQQQQQQQGGYR